MNRSKFAFIGTASLLSLSLLTPAVFAEGPASSEATITFTAPVDVPPVLDPENPNVPLDPENPENPVDPPTGQVGPLSLDYVSSIDFGNQKVSLEEETYESESLRPFIQVTDRRGGGGLGWQVTASATPFTSSDNTSALNGAEITFMNPAVVAASTNTFAAPTAENVIKLAADGTASAKVAEAEENTGLGSWLVRWFGTAENTNNNVTLTVPAGQASEADFSSTITWTLSATPTDAN
ncbi:WxL domain-containing protein [Planococcus sp. 1R117A]|uniref:WxL domain-containing protein n=1 Tax=Planococcus sp. 1R117A TaxID=3447020 RepID=UPI003EDC9A1A